jgi:hypothetical protein
MAEEVDVRMGDEPVFFRYRMKFAHGLVKTITVTLDYHTLGIMAPPRPAPPEWTPREFPKCTHCPLDPGQHARCPVAVNMIELIEFLFDLASFEEVEVAVETLERTYTKNTTLQRVAGSLMGIFMVSSGCPILNKMRPMVETHLPFATWQETVYRVMSMFLLAQYFRHKNGLAPTWSLDGIVSYYAQVQEVNAAFAGRLRAIPSLEGDASLNAVSILASLAVMASMTLQDNDLDHWEKIFMTHWGD